MAYSDKVVDHYNNPRNVGSLDKQDPEVGTGVVGAPGTTSKEEVGTPAARRCLKRKLNAEQAHITARTQRPGGRQDDETPLLAHRRLRGMPALRADLRVRSRAALHALRCARMPVLREPIG